MVNSISNVLSNRKKDHIAEILKTDTQALRLFEEKYREQVLTNLRDDNFFLVNAKQAATKKEGIEMDYDATIGDIINRIVNELLQKTSILNYDGKEIVSTAIPINERMKSVTKEELNKIPETLRPQLTGSLMKVDMNAPSCITLLEYYRMYLKEKNEKKKKRFYDMFRQGLDILDLDDITYKIIGTNPNSIGHWFPQLVEAVQRQDFFKIPKTTVIKVPLPMLQLTRLQYDTLTRTTLDIVDLFCKKAFNLNGDKEYFIKTGTYSSKFDFRNAYVHGEKEVRELGEYLLFIHHQACMMASPLNNRSIYGVSTTNEWVVREFIKDKENNPCIYKGLPLHTEYRIFVDFDTKQILGITPYWDENVMEKRFGHEDDANNPHNIHDYIIYKSHKEELLRRYNENVNRVKENIQNIVSDIEDFGGQWSIDVMQNGDDFWIIDMALAANSALSECIPKGMLRKVEENWIPELNLRGNRK